MTLEEQNVLAKVASLMPFDIGYNKNGWFERYDSYDSYDRPDVWDPLHGDSDAMEVLVALRCDVHFQLDANLMELSITRDIDAKATIMNESAWSLAASKDALRRGILIEAASVYDARMKESQKKQNRQRRPV